MLRAPSGGSNYPTARTPPHDPPGRTSSGRARPRRRGAHPPPGRWCRAAPAARSGRVRPPRRRPASPPFVSPGSRSTGTGSPHQADRLAATSRWGRSPTHREDAPPHEAPVGLPGGVATTMAAAGPARRPAAGSAGSTVGAATLLDARRRSGVAPPAAGSRRHGAASAVGRPDVDVGPDAPVLVVEPVGPLDVDPRRDGVQARRHLGVLLPGQVGLLAGCQLQRPHRRPVGPPVPFRPVDRARPAATRPAPSWRSWCLFTTVTVTSSRRPSRSPTDRPRRATGCAGRGVGPQRGGVGDGGDRQSPAADHGRPVATSAGSRRRRAGVRRRVSFAGPGGRRASRPQRRRTRATPRRACERPAAGGPVGARAPRPPAPRCSRTSAARRQPSPAPIAPTAASGADPLAAREPVHVPGLPPGRSPARRHASQQAAALLAFWPAACLVAATLHRRPPQRPTLPVGRRRPLPRRRRRPLRPRRPRSPGTCPSSRCCSACCASPPTTWARSCWGWRWSCWCWPPASTPSSRDGWARPWPRWSAWCRSSWRR